MRVGVVCEGQTDVHAITSFLEASLTGRGITPTFVEIQPETDRTQPTDGGWGAVLHWLQDNPPQVRIATYFSGGLFGGGLSAKRCDVMVFQMDADILSDTPFQKWTKRHLKHSVVDRIDPVHRGNELRAIIEIAGAFHQLSPDDKRRHIAAPAVESTETWCVAAFQSLSGDPERLTGPDLRDEFMTALHRSENRPVQQFSRIDKQPNRRRRYCTKHAVGVGRVETQCRHYRELVEALCVWNTRTHPSL